MAYSKKKNGSSLKKALSFLPLMASISGNLLFNFGKNVTAKEDSSAWDDEKEDILERANWLCKQLVKDPETLLSDISTVKDTKTRGEWAVYSCSMFVHALANISSLYPDKKDTCLSTIIKVIDIVNTPTMRRHDTIMWKEDAMESLSGDKHHMAYLSILAWMISNYRLIGGDNRYDTLFDAICEALNRRMLASPYDLNLLTYPNMRIFPPDMLVTIIALHNYARLNSGKYEETVQAWLNNAKTKWIHKKTGLLAGMLPGENKRKRWVEVRGSYSALNCSYLSLVDESFAKEQYLKTKQVWQGEASILGKKFIGIREFLGKNPDFSFMKEDAGLVIKGLSAGGTAFVLGAATYFEDWKFRYQLLRTADIAGGTVKETSGDKKLRHYKLAEQFLVGEATALAMRTNVKR